MLSRAHSSAGERSLHTREVPGSIPGAPIREASGLRRWEFIYDGGKMPGAADGATSSSTATRWHRARIERTIPFFIGTEPADVGIHGPTPVTRDYPAYDHEFTAPSTRSWSASGQWAKPSIRPSDGTAAGKTLSQQHEGAERAPAR